MEDVEPAGESIGSATVSHDAAGVPVIKLSGEIDMSNVESLRGAIDPVVEQGPERVDFDLSALDFMDSSGIALLLRVAAKTQSVHLLQPSALVRRLVEATGLSDVLQIVP
jgi:anti-sigma B factor antagonist